MKTGEEIKTWLRERVAEAIKTTADRVPTDEPFANFGLDSILIVTLVDDMEEWLQVSLDPTIFWEYPSIDSLTEWLLAEKLAN